jgi:hypothetical protein
MVCLARAAISISKDEGVKVMETAVYEKRTYGGVEGRRVKSGSYPISIE